MLGFRIISVAICMSVACGETIFYNRLMRNPGLNWTFNGTCIDSCISSCRSTQGCIAVSHQQATGACIFNTCNNVDLYQALSWNTYVIPLAFIENTTFPSPQFEWMLTTTCKLPSLATSKFPGQGQESASEISLSNYDISTSLNSFTGNTHSLRGPSDQSMAFTGASPLFNFAFGSQSLSIMLWINWKVVQTESLLFLLRNYNTTYGYTNIFSYSLSQSNLAYNGSATAPPTGMSKQATYLLSPQAGIWYHLAFVYDGSQGIIKTYVNYTLVAVNKVTVSNSYVGLGKLYFGGFNDFTNFFNGIIFCIKISTLSLSKPEITDLGDSCLNSKVRLSN